jgi:hypothetical protein
MLRTSWLKHVRLRATIWLLGINAVALSVRADPLTLSIDRPDRLRIPHAATVRFTGSITNNTGTDLDVASELFLNFAGFDAGVLSFEQLLKSPNFVLLDGTTSPDTQLFA